MLILRPGIKAVNLDMDSVMGLSCPVSMWSVGFWGVQNPGRVLLKGDAIFYFKFICLQFRDKIYSTHTRRGIKLIFYSLCVYLRVIVWKIFIFLFYCCNKIHSEFSFSDKLREVEVIYTINIKV